MDTTPSPFDLGQYGNRRVVAVILAKNEENSIGPAVEGAARCVHQVVVMDGRSTDQTPAVARRAGAVVHADDGQGKGAAI